MVDQQLPGGSSGVFNAAASSSRQLTGCVLSPTMGASYRGESSAARTNQHECTFGNENWVEAIDLMMDEEDEEVAVMGGNFADLTLADDND